MFLEYDHLTPENRRTGFDPHAHLPYLKQNLSLYKDFNPDPEAESTPMGYPGPSQQSLVEYVSS